jgi:hypothetical protein
MPSGVSPRVARPTDHLAAIVTMYATGLDFAVLTHFHDHDGFDGVILGQPPHPYHLKCTAQRGHHVGKAPTKDPLWSSTCLSGTRGKPVVPACGQQDLSRSRPTIPTGTCRGGHARLWMGTGLYSRTPRGPCRACPEIRERPRASILVGLLHHTRFQPLDALVTTVFFSVGSPIIFVPTGLQGWMELWGCSGQDIVLYSWVQQVMLSSREEVAARTLSRAVPAAWLRDGRHHVVSREGGEESLCLATRGK